MTFQNCLQGAEAGFGISAMVEGGIILATGATPPGWLAVGGLMAGAFIGCVICNYFCGKPVQPVVSDEYATIINEDEAQFNDVVRLLYDLNNAVASAVNNLSFVENGMKYDLLEILYLNYNDYYAYIQSVENYQQYVIGQFNNSLQPFIQNFILSAQAYGITLQNIAKLGEMNVISSGVNIGISIQSVNPLVVFFENTSIPAGFGVQMTVAANYTTRTLNVVYLLGDPTQQYQAVVYNQNGNPINQFNISFGNAVIEQVPLGLATLLPYLFYADFTASPGTLNGLNVQISGDGEVSLGESAEITQSFNPFNGNIAIVLNLTTNPNYDMIFTAPSNVNNYLSIQAVAQYYQFLENLDLTGYASYLWNYYHNNGVTQQELYDIINGIVFNINIPNCNPSIATQEAGTLFSILNDLALQNQTTTLNIYPVFAYGTFNVEGVGQVSGYVQFNKPTVLVPGSCTKVGGFIVTQNNQLYVIPPGQIVCNSGNYTVVFRPDIYILGNQCYFVPIPNNIAGVSNPPQNSVGIVLDLNEELVFNQGQRYSEQGWYVNSTLDSGDTIDEINFTPSQTFAYVPSELAYLVLNNQGLQTTESETTPATPPSSGINPIWLLILAVIAGIGLGLLVRYAKKHE
jgi:hypothetical protein